MKNKHSSVQSLSRVRLFVTPWIAAHQASPSITNSWSSLGLTSIESVMPSSHLILCRPLLLLSPLPSQHQSLFQWVNSSHEVAKVLVSALASFLPKKSQGWSPSEWTDWISLQSKGFSRIFSNTTVQKHQFFGTQPSSQSNSHIHTWPQEKRTFVGKVMSLLLIMLSRFVITFLPRSKHLLISWLQSPSAVILEPKKVKSDTVSTVSPSISHEVIGPEAMIFVFWMLSFKPNFSLSSFTFIKRLFSSSSLSAIRVVSSAYLRLLIVIFGKFDPKFHSILDLFIKPFRCLSHAGLCSH